MVVHFLRISWAINLTIEADENPVPSATVSSGAQMAVGLRYDKLRRVSRDSQNYTADERCKRAGRRRSTGESASARCGYSPLRWLYSVFSETPRISAAFALLPPVNFSVCRRSSRLTSFSDIPTCTFRPAVEPSPEACA